MTYPRAVGRGVTALLLLVSLPGCAERAPSPSGEGGGSTAPTPPVAESPIASFAASPPDSVGEAVRRFEGYPPLHGILVVHNLTEGDLTLEMWIDGPALWVNVVGATEIGPWVYDGETSNVLEPHVQSVALILTDPRTALLDCPGIRMIGGDEVLGRPVTGIECREDGARFVHWVDDATGMIIAGEGRDEDGPGSWEFTELELDPTFPPGIFDFDPAPPTLWFDVPTGDGATPGNQVLERAIASFASYPAFHGTALVHLSTDEDYTFELWVREPQARVDVVIPGTSYPWVGEVGDDVPDPQRFALPAVDPRHLPDACTEVTVVGSEEVVGRTSTILSCRRADPATRATVWLDDETGLIVREYWEDPWGIGWFGFTELELAPAFPADVFEPSTP